MLTDMGDSKMETTLVADKVHHSLHSIYN